jgi:hypothetical protein
MSGSKVKQSQQNILLPIEWVWRGESMVKYTKKVDEKTSSLKRGNFSRKHKKLYSNFT